MILICSICNNRLLQSKGLHAPGFFCLQCDVNKLIYRRTLAGVLVTYFADKKPLSRFYVEIKLPCDVAMIQRVIKGKCNVSFFSLTDNKLQLLAVKSVAA